LRSVINPTQSKERIAGIRRGRDGGFYTATGDGKDRKESEREARRVLQIKIEAGRRQGNKPVGKVAIAFADGKGPKKSRAVASQEYEVRRTIKPRWRGGKK
jgi:hypothetical protein